MGSTFTVTRDTVIAAPAADVYALVVDLAKWTDWSPWEGLDPDLQRTYSSDTAGVGASYGWKGNRKVGQGSMTITDVEEAAKIVIDLRFLKPFKAENVTTITFAEVDGGTPECKTTVTWSMTGPLTLIGKIMGIFMSMDKMVGPDFEKGLAQLKALAES